MINRNNMTVVIIGAGPAGLTAGYELTKHNLAPIIIEQQDKVGGIARTENYKGYYFDMGGHRFFTKSKAVNLMWKELLGDDFLLRPRLSRIYYNHKFFYYPLKYTNTLLGLGLWQAGLIMLSYIRWQIFPYKQEDTYEQWVTNRFGKRLFEIFFKTYTEKVWGIPCSELKAEWAAQRIKDLSLKTALLSMFVKPRNIKTLIEEFHYPRLGPGMLWEKVRQEIEGRNGTVYLNSTVTRIRRAGNRIVSVTVCQNGKEETIAGTHFISSMPVSEFIKKLNPVPNEALQAARKLSYRDFLTVCLIVNKPDLFPDNWIYVHAPGVKVGRIQNFKNWSPDMVPDSSKTSLGLEYFCTEGDELWTMPDSDLIELAKREIESIGLGTVADVEDGCVFRVPKAYPIYDADYRDYLVTVTQFVDSLSNFQTIGRNGLHRYNNQDHSMITGVLAVRNLLWGEKHNLWDVNGEQEYHEETAAEKPETADIADVFTHALPTTFAWLDPLAFGVSLGVISGLVLFLASIFLVLKGGEVTGLHLELLEQFFPGYAVTVEGSLVGLLYGLVAGFIIGWTIGYLRNLVVYLLVAIIRRDIELTVMKKYLEFM